MRLSLFLFLIFLAVIQVKSQDLIVKTNGDMINCKITNIQDSTIFYNYVIKDEMKSKFIHIKQVKSYEYNYYKKTVIGLNSTLNDDLINSNDFSRLRLALNFGGAYRTVKLSDGLSAVEQDYLDGIMLGYNFSGDLHYYITEQRGIGVKAGLFRASNSIDPISIRIDGNLLTGKMSDDITITYFGPSYSLRLVHGKNDNCFLLNFGVGYVNYQNNAVLIDDFVITSETLGISWDLGYDWRINKYMSAGLQLSYFYGELTDYYIKKDGNTQHSEYEEGMYESLQRIDFSFGLRFNTKKN
jgi:hypothetical protein